MHCASRSRKRRAKTSRLAENTDNIRGFGASDFFATAVNSVQARAARDQKNCRDDALSMPSSLCKKSSVKGLARAALPSIPARIARIASK